MGTKKLTYDFGLPCRKEASEWMLIMSVCDFGKRKEVVYQFLSQRFAHVHIYKFIKTKFC